MVERRRGRQRGVSEPFGAGPHFRLRRLRAREILSAAMLEQLSEVGLDIRGKGRANPPKSFRDKQSLANSSNWTD